jgi:hypothetical protein
MALHAWWRAIGLFGLLVTGLPALPAGLAGDRPAAAGQFAGTWRLAMITDGKRTRTDLAETLSIDVDDNVLHLHYTIVDRFGSRVLDLSAALDGKPAIQTAQNRRAVFSAQMDDERLVLELLRDAPFGRMHNRRSMRISDDGQTIESQRSNIGGDGRIESAWTETWLRLAPGAANAGHDGPGRASLAPEAGAGNSAKSACTRAFSDCRKSRSRSPPIRAIST